MAKKILYLLLVFAAIAAVAMIIIKIAPYVIIASGVFPWILDVLNDGGNVK